MDPPPSRQPRSHTTLITAKSHRCSRAGKISEYSYDLVRTGDRASFALILYSKQLEALAQASIVEAARLDAEEAPQRELDKQKKRDDDDRLALG